MERPSSGRQDAEALAVQQAAVLRKKIALDMPAVLPYNASYEG